MAPVALGIRPHSGWAVVVAVTGPPDVTLLARRRIEVVAPGDPRQCWHAAQDGGLDPAAAEALETRVAAGARAAADAALAAVLAEVGGAVAAGIVGEPRDLPGGDRILANHSLLHSAEGELYRSVLDDAATALGLTVLNVHPKAVPLADHAELLAELKAAAGPPWQADHRLATVVALEALRA